MDAAPIPRFPDFAARLLAALPSSFIGAILARLADVAAERHPGLFVRLGSHAAATFLIDPQDLPFGLALRPSAARDRVSVVRRDDAMIWDARIAGPLAALIGLVHGAYDGDALFFSRDLTIEGDTEAVLALRNAVDCAEIDLADEALAMLGPLRSLAAPPLRRILPLVARASGIALMRVDGARRDR